MEYKYSKIFIFNLYIFNKNVNINIPDMDLINDEVTIEYDIKNSKEIRLFGDNFVKNNKNKCKIIYNGKEYNLTEYFEINNPKIIILEIKLIGINNIEDTRCMFCGYNSSI